MARVEIGSQDYQFSTRLNGKPSTAVGVQLSPGANALNTAPLVRAKMDELSRYFPANVEYKIPYDTSPFVKVSITKVLVTLGEAMVLVFAVRLTLTAPFPAPLAPPVMLIQPRSDAAVQLHWAAVVTVIDPEPAGAPNDKDVDESE